MTALAGELAGESDISTCFARLKSSENTANDASVRARFRSRLGDLCTESPSEKNEVEDISESFLTCIIFGACVSFICIFVRCSPALLDWVPTGPVEDRREDRQRVRLGRFVLANLRADAHAIISPYFLCQKLSLYLIWYSISFDLFVHPMFFVITKRWCVWCLSLV